jgi:hypothetical protein
LVLRRWARLAAACTLSLLSALVAARVALAQNEAGPRVIVLTSNPDAPFVRRLAAELSLFGYQIEVATRSEVEGDLEEVLARSGGAALIAVDQGKQTAEVVVARSSTGAPRRERESLDPRRRADTNAAVLAERFRARLTELGIAPASSPMLAAPPEPVRVDLPRRAVEPERRLWFAAAFGGSSGGLGLRPDAQLELRAFPVPWLSTSAFAKVSPLAATVKAPEGEADLRWLAGGVLIDAYPIRGPVVVKAGLGAMLVSTEMTGRAAPPWGGRTDTVLVPAGLAEAGAALRLGPRASAELQGFVGVCSPRVGVRFAGRTVAGFGQPLFGASLGLAVGVF